MLTMNASWMLVRLSLSRYVYVMETEAGRVHMEDTASQTVCSVVSKDYIQVIVFYLLAQTKVIYIYLHIYKPINKVS